MYRCSKIDKVMLQHSHCFHSLSNCLLDIGIFTKLLQYYYKGILQILSLTMNVFSRIPGYSIGQVRIFNRVYKQLGNLAVLWK